MPEEKLKLLTFSSSSRYWSASDLLENSFLRTLPDSSSSETLSPGSSPSRFLISAGIVTRPFESSSAENLTWVNVSTLC